MLKSLLTGFAVTLVLVQQAVYASAILVTDYRDIIVSARSPDESQHFQYARFGPTSPPSINELNESLNAEGESQGGPGSSYGSAYGQQHSFMTPDGFEGELNVRVRAFSVEHIPGWDYFGEASAESIFGVRFDLSASHPYDVTVTGSGNVSFSLVNVSTGDALESSSGFTSLHKAGQLQPGTYDLYFQVSDAVSVDDFDANAFASAESSASFNFAFRSVPDGGTTGLLMVFAFLGLAPLSRRLSLDKGARL